MAVSFMLVGLVVVGVVVALIVGVGFLAVKGSKGAAIGVSVAFGLVLLMMAGSFALFNAKRVDVAQEHEMMINELTEASYQEALVEIGEVSADAEQLQISITYTGMASDKVDALNELLTTKLESPLKDSGCRLSTTRTRTSSGGMASGSVKLSLVPAADTKMLASRAIVDGAVEAFEKALAQAELDKVVRIQISSHSNQ